MVRDGTVLTGDVIGEMGSSILFRDQRPGSRVKAIQISDMVAAWKVPADTASKVVIRPPEVGRDFRMIDPDEVDFLTRSVHEVDGAHPSPDVYYEVHSGHDEYVVSMDNPGVDGEKVMVEVRGRTLHVIMDLPEGKRDLSLDLPSDASDKPSVKVTDHLIEVSLQLRA